MKRFKAFLMSLLPWLASQAIATVISMFIMELAMLYFVWFPPDRSNGIAGAFAAVGELLISSDGIIFTSIIVLLVNIILLGWWYRLANKGKKGVLYINDFNIMSLAALVIGTVAVYICVDYLAEILAFLKPEWMEAMAELQKTEGIIGNGITPMLLFYGCIVGPVSEEIVFRGLTLHYAKKAFPVWLAVIYQSLIFAFTHFNILQGIYTFLTGLILGAIVVYTGSIVWTILVHMILNTAGFLLPLLYPFIPGNAFVLVLILLAAVVVALVCGYFFYRGVTLKHLENECLMEDNEVLDLNEV